MNDIFSSRQTDLIRRKKFAILLCGVVLYFLTCMAKLLIPGIIFNDLLKIGLDARMISGTGAAFMYAYAASQLLAGIYSNRYGGVRILLIGGSLFAAGTIGFPWCGNYWLMLFFRVLTGLGAGTVFLGVVKLISDLFPAKFAIALGTVMLCSYFGPVCGTTPMVLLVKAVNWQWAMTIPGMTAAAGVFFILLLMRGTIKATVPGSTIRPLLAMLKNREMWKYSMTIPVIFGLYYIISTQLGQKSLTDHCGLSAEKASAVIMTLTIIVALNNVSGNILLKLCGNRKKTVLQTALLTAGCGALICMAAFKSGNSALAVSAGFILLAIPAGFFPLFSDTVKEINPPEETGLAVALLNFWCFIFIAGFQNIAGRILQCYTVSTSHIYPSQAYYAVFTFMIAAVIYGTVMTFFLRKKSSAVRK